MANQHYLLKWAVKPHGLQQEIIDYLDGKHLSPHGNPYRFLIAAIGRQWGKSWLAKRTLIDRANNHKQVCMWIAPTIPTARGHWQDMVNTVRNSGIPVEKISQSSKEIHFFGGGIISVRSVIEPDNLRGASLDYAVLDEAAFFRDGEYCWYGVILPMVTATGGKVLVPTTPNGRNWLYTLFKNGQNPLDKYYKSWNVPSHTSPFQDKELLAELKKTMPDIRWREEFMAEFLADGGGVFAGVERASVVQPLLEPLDNHRYVAGVDFGFTTDNTTFTVIDKYTREQVWGEAFNNIGTVRTVKRIVRLLDIWQPEVTVVEKNGIGESLFDLLREIVAGREIEDILDFINTNTDEDKPLDEVIGGHHLKAVHMTNELKRGYVERLSADIEYGRVKLLAADSKYGDMQISEMSTYERKRTVSGVNITYAAAGEAHDDTITSLYLANKALPKYKKWKMPTKGDKPATRTSPFKGGSSSLGKLRRFNNAQRSKVHPPD